MSRKNKYANKKGKQSYNNESSKNKEEFSINRDELADEAIFVYTLMRESENALMKDSEKYGYVISYTWYLSWQDYVSYDEVIEEKPYKRTMGVRNPGFINRDLLEDSALSEAYFKLPKELLKAEYGYMEQYINSKILDKNDYMVVDARAWEFFSNKYGGITVKRPIHHTNSSSYNDVELQRVK